jgi:hypothetical protein
MSACLLADWTHTLPMPAPTTSPSPDHLAIWLGATVAVFVAVLAAATAQWRQHRELNAARHRLAQQLRHDRHLHDLAEVRALLDEIVAHITTVMDAARHLEMVVEYMVPKPQPSQQESGRKAAVAAWQAFEPLRGDWDRLALRVGDQHPVAQGLAELRGTLHTALAVPGHATGPFDDEQRNSMTGAMDAARHSAASFIEQAHRAPGSLLVPSG